MRDINIHFQGKDYTIKYKVETIDLSMTPVSFINVFSVFIDHEDLKKITGSHFTLVQNIEQNIHPAFAKKNPGDIEENNLKKLIAQQIMNDKGK